MSIQLTEQLQLDAAIPSNASQVSLSSSWSSRLVKRILYFHRNRRNGKIIMKSRSQLVSGVGKPTRVSGYIDPKLQSALAFVVEATAKNDTSLATYPKGWPSHLNAFPDRRQFAWCWEQYQKNLVPRVRLSSGAIVIMSTPQELCDYWHKRGYPDPEKVIVGWVVKAEVNGLQGGNPGAKNKKLKRRKRRARVGGSKARTTSKGGMIESGQLGLRVPNQMKSPFPVTKDFWRYESILETDASGNVSAFVSLRNPLTALNGSGVYPRAQDFAKLYDEYKVLNLSIVLDYLFINPQVGDTYIATDYDSIPAGTYTINDLKDNQYVRIFSGTNQIKYATKVPKLASGSYRGQPTIIHQGGFLDFNTPPEEGAIVIAMERYIPGVRIARISISMEVLMRRRRTLPNALQRAQRRLSK